MTLEKIVDFIKKLALYRKNPWGAGHPRKPLAPSLNEMNIIIFFIYKQKLEEARSRFHEQFNREPTLVEWAEAVSLSSHELKSQLHLGSSSREKLICANLSMVVYIAKQYRRRSIFRIFCRSIDFANLFYLVYKKFLGYVL